MHHVRYVTQQYTFMWELIFCLIHCVQTPENTLTCRLLVYQSPHWYSCSLFPYYQGMGFVMCYSSNSRYTHILTTCKEVCITNLIGGCNLSYFSIYIFL